MVVNFKTFIEDMVFAKLPEEHEQSVPLHLEGHAVRHLWGSLRRSLDNEGPLSQVQETVKQPFSLVACADLKYLKLEIASKPRQNTFYL